MARLNIIVCDLCGVKQTDAPQNKLSIKQGKQPPIKGEICDTCASDLIDRVKYEKTGTNLVAKKQIASKTADGDAIVPSALTNEQIKHSNKKSTVCTHERTSFEPPNLICKDCGDKTPI